MLPHIITLISSFSFFVYWSSKFDPLPVYLPSSQSTHETQTLVQEVEHLFEGEIQGPESLLFDHNGLLYTGISNGSILQIDPFKRTSNVFITPGIQLDPTSQGVECGNSENEHLCGRPLGLKFNQKGDLLIADSYLGLIEVSNGKAKVLVDSYEGEKLKFVNDLVLDMEGNVYFTSSSTKYDRREWRLDLFEGRPTGRLFKMDHTSNKVSLLIGDLFFANGVYLSKNEEFLVVVETGMSRLKRHWIKGPRKGVTEMFVENLPGIPDNIRPDDQGGMFVGFGAKRSTLIDNLQKYPLFKKMVVVTGLHEYVHLMAPSYGLFVRISEDGVIIESFHDPKGKGLRYISEVEVRSEGYYFGSVLNNFICFWKKNKDN